MWFFEIICSFNNFGKGELLFKYYLKADADVIANKTVAVVCLSFHVDGLKKIFKGVINFSHLFWELALGPNLWSSLDLSKIENVDWLASSDLCHYTLLFMLDCASFIYWFTV